jgi:hypothetical protein
MLAQGFDTRAWMRQHYLGRLQLQAGGPKSMGDPVHLHMETIPGSASLLGPPHRQAIRHRRAGAALARTERPAPIHPPPTVTLFSTTSW